MKVSTLNNILFPVVALTTVGLIFLASISLIISQQQFNTPFLFIGKQFVAIVLGFFLMFVTSKIPLSFWYRYHQLILIVVIFLHAMLLVPGIGRHINGSTRWINLGFINFQISELAKIGMVLYMAGFCCRKNDEVRDKLFGFFKPILLLVLVAMICLMQPDFGAMVVIVLSSSVILFLAGARIRHFLLFIVMASSSMAVLAATSPYRVKRLTSFLDPWAHPFSEGYQLTQALIAFGKGGSFGVGLGNSLQKMFYLPEAHTDFLFAVMVEEGGLAIGMLVVGLFAWFAYCGFSTAYSMVKKSQWFSYYLSFGITFTLILQALINLGVNMGMLPTKGITLPFISYGGSSILVSLFAVGILYRCDIESKEI
ncbi:MAG TPA: putative lipid II flippase FtsW [Gammaproteobacteria bacterium]|nr:putative lipid II flippase FtsW [Gammaproteobacteria bacterium]